MNLERRNKNRGYQQLLVWQDAIELYRVVFRAVRGWPFKQNKLASQSLASSDSVHRNTAEGYCRRTIREYLQHLNIALGSLGETLSGFIAYSQSGQIVASALSSSTPLSFVESLERKRDAGDWTETLVVREDAPDYGTDPDLTHDLGILLDGVKK